MKLMAVWTDKREHDPYRRKRVLNGLLVRHPDDGRAVLCVEGEYYEPRHVSEHTMVGVYLFNPMDEPAKNLLVEAKRRGYNLHVTDASKKPWRDVEVPTVRIVRGDEDDCDDCQPEEA